MKRLLTHTAILGAILVTPFSYSNDQKESPWRWSREVNAGCEVPVDCKNFLPQDCPDRIQGSVNFLYLKRSEPAKRILAGATGVTNGVTSVTNTIDASNYDFDFEAGLDVSAAIRLGESADCLVLEARGMGLSEFTGYQDFRATQANPTLPIFFNTANPNLTLPPVALVHSTYTSELSSFEVNLKKQLECVEVSLGLRYVNLDESASIVAQGLVSNYTLLWQTDNDFYAVQAGAQGELGCIGRCKIVAFGRGAIGVNSAELAAQTSEIPLSTGNREGGNSDTFFASMVEAGFGLEFPISDHSSLYAGYHGVLLNNMATAADNLQHVTTANTTANPVQSTVSTEVRAGTSVYYHGLKTGYSFVW